MTNREKLRRALADIREVRDNNVIGPSCYERLVTAGHEIEAAMKFVLDENEQDGVRTAATT